MRAAPEAGRQSWPVTVRGLLSLVGPSLRFLTSRGHLFLIGLLAAMALVMFSWATPAAAQARSTPVRPLTEWQQAQAAPLGPAATAAEWDLVPTIPLPDDWALTRPNHRGTLSYRVQFDGVPGGDPDALLGLYVERACSVLQVRLNGQLVHDGGLMDNPVARNCHRPQLVALPASLMKTGANELLLQVRGFALQEVSSRQRAGGLSRLELGPYPLLADHHGRRLALAVHLPEVMSGTLALMGSFMFVMGWFNRQQSYLAYFGALMVGWAIMLARLWTSQLPLSNHQAELVLAALMAFITLAAVQFLLRYAGEKRRWLNRLLPLQCAVMPASLVLAGPAHLFTASGMWFALLSAQVSAAAVYHLVKARQMPGRQFWLMATLLAVVGVSLSVELLAQTLALDSRVGYVAQLLPALGFLLLGLHLVQQYGRAYQSAEQSRAELEVRIREATAQIERNFAQLAELKVEQVTDRERKRIAADLHDDLGAKLLTIVHTSESERISTLAREALEEMRLSVRGLTGKPVKLSDALGDWRAEVVSRLTQSGVQGEWSAPSDEETQQTLSSRAYVQTTRILREAVSNVIKHSGASQCSVRANIAQGDFQLVIQDNGHGIPVEMDGRLDKGHGMASMKGRAKQLQGQCLVESGPGYGTVIRLTLPLERHVTNG